jgi:DNA-binding NtrC family response regulator
MPANNADKRERVLLIDGKSDAPLVGRLEQQGYEVITCESPQKAWGLVYPIRPHFIILHLEEPSSRDVYALQECRALADGVPVIIATGASRIDALTRELGKGNIRFLSLPLKPNALRKIRHELDSSIGDQRPESEPS